MADSLKTTMDPTEWKPIKEDMASLTFRKK